MLKFAGTGGPTGIKFFDLFIPRITLQNWVAWLRSDQETWTEVEFDVVDFVITGEVGTTQ
ncbi:MAG: hypothetical protein CM15mP22_4190 [Gammaproteobacteria bacterium]|nr:MAG: hypothetical protein CM15mP22_4190 [Gammaproteobacteria bacterium]